MKFLLPGMVCLGLMAPASASATSLQYYGGPVSHSMSVYVVPWGSGVRSTYTDANTGDPGLFKYLASQNGTTTDIGGVLAQYMDNTRVNSQNRFAYAGSAGLSPPTSGSANGCALPTCVDDSFIQSALRNAISASALPAPTGTGLQTMYVVLFPPNVNVCLSGSCAYGTSSGFCAYHGSSQLPSSGPHVLYAAMVDNGPNTPNYGLCGSPSSSDLANQTDVLSHEVAETINDPLVGEATANGPPLGWYDANQHDPNGGGEIGDICVGSTEQALNGAWTVQKLWSNRDSNCVAGESAYSAPSASFLADTTATTAQVVSFDGSASSDPAGNTASAAYSHNTYSIASGLASYRWDWGDGSASTSSSSPTATHAYASAGNYQASLTVTDNLGFTSTVTKQIAVTNPPPVVTTGAASGVGYQGATLNGTINPENQTVQYRFIYGTSPTELTQSTPLLPGPTGQSASPVSAVLSGLSPSTTYYFELEAVSGSQTYTDSPASAQSFTTTAPPATQTPSASTGTPTQISTTTAELNGTINPDGPATVTYWFAYGTSPTSLNQTTPATTQPGGTSDIPVSASISGLSPDTNYYYALEVSLNNTTSAGTTQPFTTSNPPPVVTTGTASGVDYQGATLNGTINPEDQTVQYEFIYGTSPTELTKSTPLTPGPTGQSASAVSATLSSLSPSTTYYYKLQAVSGNQTYTDPASPQSFTTTAAPPIQTPSASTGTPTQISTTTAELNGTINPDGPATVTYWFAYGTSPTSLNQSTFHTTQAGGTSDIPVSASIANLSPGTVYYYTLEVSLNNNTPSRGATQPFTTSTPPTPSNPATGATPTSPNPAPAAGIATPPGPGVTTGSASHVSSSGATVAGTVNPNGSATTYQVQFGPSAAYGYSSAPVAAGSGSASLPVSVTLGGLKARTTYHYRLVATTAYTTVVGGDQTFTTARALARAPRFSFRILGAPTLPGALRGGINVRFSCSRACVAHFSVLEVPGAGVLRVGGTPLTIASGSGRRRSKGSATARVRFSHAMQKRLKSVTGLKLIITGVAVGNGTLPSSPVPRKVTLHRAP